MLGYEPSTIHSRVFLADYTRCACDLGVLPHAFLNEPFQVLPQPQQFLSRYVTELPQPQSGHSRLLLMNNSSLPFTPAGEYPLGVLHRAEIVAPSPSERRVVNSVMLVHGKPDINCGDWEAEFVSTNKFDP